MKHTKQTVGRIAIMFNFLKPRAEIAVTEGAYGTPNFGYERGTVQAQGQEIFKTGWFTGGARIECQLWCDENGYRYDIREKKNP